MDHELCVWINFRCDTNQNKKKKKKMFSAFYLRLGTHLIWTPASAIFFFTKGVEKNDDTHMKKKKKRKGCVDGSQVCNYQENGWDNSVFEDWDELRFACKRDGKSRSRSTQQCSRYLKMNYSLTPTSERKTRNEKYLFTSSEKYDNLHSLYEKNV